jgi:hypothetical protein
MFSRSARLIARPIVRSQVRTMAGGGPRLPPPGGYKGLEYVLRGVLFKEDWQFAYFMIGLWGTIIWAGKTFIKMPEKPAAAPAVAGSTGSDAPSLVDSPDEWVKWIEAPGNMDKLVDSMGK